MLHGEAHIKAQKQITSKKKCIKEQTFNIWVLLLSIHKEKHNMNQTEKHCIIIIHEIQSVCKAKEIFLSLSNILQDQTRNETTHNTALQPHCIFLFVHHKAPPRRYPSVGLFCLAAVVFRWFKDTTKLPLLFYSFLKCQ